MLLNHRLGAIRPKIGTTQYYLSLAPGAWRTFNDEDQSFWCCTGTGVEEYAKLNDSIYWRDRRGVFVNLFIPSELDWAEKGLKLRQETGYPAAEATTITVVAAPAATLALRIRIPGWLSAAPTVKLNGRALEAMAEPGSYLTLNRTWKAGDRIDVALPMQLHVEALPDEPQTQAFLYGPLVLAGDFGAEGLTEAHLAGPNLRVGNPNPPPPQAAAVPGTPNPIPPVPSLQIPVLRPAAPDLASWIKPTDKPQVFRTTGQAKDVTLVPFHTLVDRRYVVYWQVEPSRA